MRNIHRITLGAFLLSTAVCLSLALAACGDAPTATAVPAPTATKAPAATAGTTAAAGSVNPAKLAELKNLNKYIAGTKDELEKNDTAGASREFKEFLEGWEELEDFVKPAVLYGYRDVEASISNISKLLFSTTQPVVAANILPEVKELQRKYNEVVAAMEKPVSTTPTAKP